MPKIEFYERRTKAPKQQDIDPEKNKPRRGERFIGAMECETATATRVAKNLAAETFEKNEVVVKVQDANDKGWWNDEFAVQGLSSEDPDKAKREASASEKTTTASRSN